MNIENDVQGVIEGILSGKLIDTFDKYYADDVDVARSAAAPRGAGGIRSDPSGSWER